MLEDVKAEEQVVLCRRRFEEVFLMKMQTVRRESRPESRGVRRDVVTVNCFRACHREKLAQNVAGAAADVANRSRLQGVALEHATDLFCFPRRVFDALR